jgi:hypothetical protein
MFEGAAELAKGKRTTDKTRHAGEGIFFSKRMAKSFSIAANGIAYRFDRTANDWTVKLAETRPQTAISLSIEANATYSARDVVQKYTNDEFHFTKSASFIVQPYVLAVPGSLVSRSETEKLLAGAEAFEQIELDFHNVEDIGQGFADEVFRVYPGVNPTIRLSFRNANDAIQAMISHVTNKRLAFHATFAGGLHCFSKIYGT